MEYKSCVNICRICLEDGADIPIFENNESKLNVYLKLTKCFGEILDMNGFPRNICKLCNITLNTTYNFMKQYTESNIILQKGLKSVLKIENINYRDYVDMDADIKFESAEETDIKLEPSQHKIVYKENNVIVEPIQRKLKDVKITKVKELKKLEKLKNQNGLTSKLKKVKKQKYKRQLKDSKIKMVASSILEGDFVWTGKLWRKRTKTLMDIRNKKALVQDVEKMEELAPKKQKPAGSRLCDLCGEVFSNQVKLKRHVNKIHKMQEFACTLCVKKFHGDRYLAMHMKRAHSKDEDKFICSECGKLFAYQYDLNTHYKNVHLKTKPTVKKHSCGLCDRNFVTKKTLLIHKRSVHTGERPAVCQFCGTAFYHEDYLMEHVRLHTGERPYKCPLCDLGYAQRCNLRSHIKHRHRRSQIDDETMKNLKPGVIRLLRED